MTNELIITFNTETRFKQSGVQMQYKLDIQLVALTSLLSFTTTLWKTREEETERKRCQRS